MFHRNFIVHFSTLKTSEDPIQIAHSCLLLVVDKLLKITLSDHFEKQNAIVLLFTTP